MKYTNVLYALLPLIFASTTVARDCTKGLNYCGSILADIGDAYTDQTRQHLYDVGDPNYANINQKLFHCVGGTGGIIEFIEDCSASRRTCHNGGSGQNDFCA
ncbi:hypothetical protein M422DRAFT_45185 [Sphaerobolus stellatus SS14]|nr:hypothetical protein M422DRAFT_45185 [Sphaerobolus stellatus SS14]